MELEDEPYSSGPELMVGAVYGYRWWRLGPSGELFSPWRGPYAWERGLNEAQCLLNKRLLGGWRAGPSRWFGHTERVHDTPIPARECHCGFYGLWGIPIAAPGVIPMLWEIDPSTSGAGHGFIFGVVQGSGRLLLGTDGFRARWAQPVAVATGGAVAPSPSYEALRYRFDVQTFGSVLELVAEWGSRVGEGLRLLDPDSPFRQRAS
jgi:hypothetical protein